MLELTTRELLALQLVLKFVPVRELLLSAMNQFATDGTPRAKDNSDVCFKAVQTYLE